MYKIFEETQFVGKRVIYLPKCRSTNDIAAEKLRRGDLEAGDIVITDHQYTGRGQRGNSWDSNATENLTFSVVLKPLFIPPSENFYLNIMTSVSIIEVLKNMAPKGFRIKWPNDIMYEDQKLGGILIENNIQSGRIRNSIIGIGLNVNQTKFDPAIRASSLKLIFNTTFDLNTIFNRIIHQFENKYLLLKSRKFDELKGRYLTNLYWLNEEHLFLSSISSEKFHGVIKGIDESGQLRVEFKGSTGVFNFKEIIYLK